MGRCYFRRQAIAWSTITHSSCTPTPQLHGPNDVYRYGLTGSRTENMQLFASRGYAVLAPDAPIPWAG